MAVLIETRFSGTCTSQMDLHLSKVVEPLLLIPIKLLQMTTMKKIIIHLSEAIDSSISLQYSLRKGLTIFYLYIF